MKTWKSLPVPVVVAIIFLSVVCVYGLTRLPTALSSGGFGAGQIFGLVLAASTIGLLLLRPAIGRWLCVAHLMLGALYCGLTIAIAVAQGDGDVHLLIAAALLFLFLALSYFLVFGTSTRAYAKGEPQS